MEFVVNVDFCIIHPVDLQQTAEGYVEQANPAPNSCPP